jgi:hypothetical protein
MRERPLRAEDEVGEASVLGTRVRHQIAQMSCLMNSQVLAMSHG